MLDASDISIKLLQFNSALPRSFVSFDYIGTL